MCCLTCAYFDPIESSEHRKEREANRCTSQCGKQWDWHTAFHYVGAHEEPLFGICRHAPEGLRKASWDVCGQHYPVLPSLDNGWGVREFGSKDNDRSLMEFAQEQYLTIKNFNKTSENGRIAALEEQNRALRKQLATARKRSAVRLARLQKAAKPIKEARSVQPQLRLVAN